MTLAERNQLVVDHLPLAHKCACKLHRRFRRKFDLDDFKQAGAVGLLDAAERYDPAKGPFESFAGARAYGAILDLIRSPNGRRREVETVKSPEILADARGDEGTAYVDNRDTVGWVLKSLAPVLSHTLHQHYFRDVELAQTGDVTFNRRRLALRDARKLMECAA